MTLPNTEMQYCDHESHDEQPARAVTRFRFAVAGELQEFWGCLEHRQAQDFGYVPPKSVEETLAGAVQPDKDSVLKTGARVRYRARGLSPGEDDRLGEVVGYGTEGKVRIKADHDGELYDVGKAHFVYIDDAPASEDRPSEANADESGEPQGSERGRDEPDEAAASRELDAAREEIASEPEEPPNQSVGDLDVETGADDEL